MYPAHSEESVSIFKKTAVLLLVLSLVISISSGPVLAQEGTTIPGSGSNPADSPSGTETTEGGKTAGQSSGGKSCDGALDCAGDSLGHIKDSYVSLGKAGINAINPMDSKDGSEKYKEAQTQREKAGEDAEAAKDELPSAWSMIAGTITDAISHGVDILMSVTDEILWAMFALPAPGQPTDIGSWFPDGTAPLSNNSSNVSNATIAANNSSNSTENITSLQPMVEGDNGNSSVLPAGLNFNAWWSVVWKVYASIAGLMAFFLLIMAIFTFSSNSYTPRERNQRLKGTAASFLLVIFGPFIMPAILHFGNVLVAGLIPDASALLTDPSQLLKVGSTITLSTLGAHFAIGAIATQLTLSGLLGFGQWILTFLLAATWIFWAPLYGSQNATLKSWSRMGFAALGILVGLKIIQAVLFWILWMLPVSWSAPAESVMSLLIFPIGLWVIFYKLPKGAMKKAVPSVVSSITTGTSSGGGFTYDNSTNRNFVHNIGDTTNNPDPSGEDPGDSSDNSGGSDSGGSGGITSIPGIAGIASGLSTLNPFSSGEGGDEGSDGRSRIRDWAPDSLFGDGGDSSTPNEGTNNPDGGSEAVLNNADHDDRSDQGVTEAEAEDAYERTDSRDEGIRPEMAEAIAGEADDLPPEETDEDPADFDIEDPDDGESHDEISESDDPFDGEIPPEIQEEIEGSEGDRESYDEIPESDDPFDGEIPPEIQEEIEGSEEMNGPPDEIPPEIQEDLEDPGDINELHDEIPEQNESFSEEIPPEVREKIEEMESTDTSNGGNNDSASEEMPDEYRDLIEESEPPDVSIPEDDSDGRARNRDSDLSNEDGDSDENN